MGADGGKLLADAIKAHPNYTQIAMNMFDGKADVDMSNKGLDAGDAFIIAAALEKNDQVTGLHASKNAMGTAGAKAFGDMLLGNKTIQTLDVSDNSFGKMQVGDQVKLKSSGEMCTLTYGPDGDNEVKVTKADGSQSRYMKLNLFEWESQVPAFCAGVAASPSLLSVSLSTIFRHPQGVIFLTPLLFPTMYVAQCFRERSRPSFQGCFDESQTTAAPRTAT